MPRVGKAAFTSRLLSGYVTEGGATAEWWPGGQPCPGPYKQVGMGSASSFTAESGLLSHPAGGTAACPQCALTVHTERRPVCVLEASP